MNFTPQEQKMVAGLRKWQRQWLKWRRWQLLLGVIELGCGFWILYQLQAEVGQSGASDLPLVIFVFGFPMAILAGVGGAIHTGIVIRDWHGNVQSTLLLKLIDHCESEDKDTHQK